MLYHFIDLVSDCVTIAGVSEAHTRKVIYIAKGVDTEALGEYLCAIAVPLNLTEEGYWKRGWTEQQVQQLVKAFPR
jgi:hypothetical protein